MLRTRSRSSSWAALLALNAGSSNCSAQKPTMRKYASLKKTQRPSGLTEKLVVSAYLLDAWNDSHSYWSHLENLFQASADLLCLDLLLTDLLLQSRFDLFELLQQSVLCLRKEDALSIISDDFTQLLDKVHRRVIEGSVRIERNDQKAKA